MTSDDAPTIRFESVTKSYSNGETVFALNGISLDIGQGERVAVMGPSGSGKSTLLNLVCGLDRPTSGEVFFEGKALTAIKDDDLTRLRRDRVGMIFQTFNLLPTLTGVENVALPLRLKGIGSREAKEKAVAMLHRVGLAERSENRPDELSGGERQRVAIARALIFDPPVLLADEPTGNLDSHTGDEILRLMDDLHNEFNTTIVLVTHNEQAAERCERKITLLDGRIGSDESAMFSALDQITFRQWQQHKLRLALTILGIALGVAVFFAVRTANRTLISSLNVTIEKLAGKATLQIVAGEAGFSKELLDRVRATTGVSEAEPVTETFATTTLNGEKLLILGLDTSSDLKIYEDSFDQGNISIKNPLAFASRGDSIAVTRSFANRFALKEGDKITIDVAGGRREMTVRGLFSASGAGSVFDGNVAVMDIVAAQDAFGREDRIDRIDLSNTPEVSSDQVQENLKAWLPSGITAVRPNLRGQGLENAVSSMHYGLAIMSSLALTIGIFIIFNSFSISLNQRWKEIGILRALGVTRGQVQRMFLAEAALMGVTGAVIGVAAGYGLAVLSMGFVGNAMASFYGFASSPQAPEFNITYGMQALLAGIVTSLIAAWLPARVASRLEPALALHNVESRQRESIIGWPRLIVGVVLVITSVALIRFVDPNVGVNFQLFYCFIGQLGLILLVPKITQIGARIIRPVLNQLFGVEGLIAVETMANAPRRTTATVIALMIGLGLVFSHESFIRSQKAAMDRALDKALASDMLVNASGEIHSRTYHISEDTANRIGSLSEIARADPVRVTTLSYNGQEVTILAHDMDAYFAISPDLLDVGDVEKARAATASGEGMLVSTNFATRFGLGVGDQVTLDTPSGPLPLTIAGMLDYYRSEKGTIFMERSLYKKYWRDSDVDTILLDLKDGADHQAVRGEINRVLAGQQAFIYTHEEFRRWVDVLVDQFFALMYVQMAIAFLVAVLGLVNTMVISVAERRRELGIFRAVGGMRRQVSKMIMLEAVAIALIGLFAGTISGLLNAYFLVKTAARVVAGYSLPLTFPASMILWAIPVIVILAVISAWFPARKAGRLNVVDAIGYE